MSHDADHKALLAYLYRALDLLPGVPPSMRQTLRTSCLKAVRRLHHEGALSDGEACSLNIRARSTTTKEVIHD